MDSTHWKLQAAPSWPALALLAVYALFFTVFRLLTFNLLLAAIWGVALSSRFLQQPGKP